jgi:protein O-GlcNAc transferase
MPNLTCPPSHSQVNVHDKSFRLLARNVSTPRGRMTVKPFPRKQFPHSLDTVTELSLESVDAPANDAALEAELECSEVHEVPAIVFSTAGHTGNYYHDMNDGWVPIFITSYPYEREVVFIVADPVGWWFDKYVGMINAMTKYPVLKLGEDQPVHCFREVKFGLISHGDMAVDETLPPHIKLEWLGQRWAKTAGFPVLPTRVSSPTSGNLKLGWVHRAEKERNVLNEQEVLDKARSMGFEVTLLNRFRNMEEMFQTIQPLDVLMGLHGSGLSNFIFMRGNCVLIQLVPFELGWFSDNSFGIGAQISRVKYISPALSWNESSLSEQFSEDSEVHLHPEQINARDGWQAWAHYYLEANVTLKMETVENALQEAKDHLLTPGAVAEHRPWLKPFDGSRRR